MGPFGVVVRPPVVENLLGLGDRGKPMLRETLASQRAIEGLDQAVVPRFARSTEVEPSEAGIASQGTRAVVQAMRATDVRRIVVVSAATIGTVPSPGRPQPPKHDPGDGFFMRHLLSPLTKAALRTRYGDLALMEDLLRDSGLDWTVVRPPQLTN